MDYAINDVGWVFVRGRATGFHASTLIDGDIYNHAAIFHRHQILARDQTRRFGTGNQNRTNDQVGQSKLFADRMCITEDRVDIGWHDIVEIPQPIQVHIH